MTVLRSLGEARDLGFGQYFAPLMALSRYRDGAWTPVEYLDFAPLKLDPGAKVLHYAQEIFEGLKLFRQPQGKLALFRPMDNIRRMTRSAELLALPPFPEEIYLEALLELSRRSQDFVPKEPGALYFRPTLIGTTPTLGVAPAKEALFYICASPVGGYFGSLQSELPASVAIWVSREHVRAVRGGLGAAKTGANYAASLRAVGHAKRLGFDNVLFLDALERRYLEELSGMNIFVVDDGRLVTPPLRDTILDGVTRKTLLELAPTLGIEAAEVPITIEELPSKIAAGRISEIFACGTGASVTAITSLGLDGKRITVGSGEPGPLTTGFFRSLLDIQYGRKPPLRGDWIVTV